MNRRAFLGSVAVAAASVMWQRSTTAQSRPASTQPSSAAERSEVIRAAAQQFLQTLAPERRSRLLFAFPKGQVPTAVGFSGAMGRPRGAGVQRHDVSFDTDGHPVQDAGHNGPPGGGGGPPGSGGAGGQRGGPMAAGEKFGDAVWTNFPVDNVARPGVRMGEFTADERDAVHALLKVVLSPMGYQKVLNIMAADQKVADAGADYAAGFDVYTLGLFGQPDAAAPWMLQFGGHHLGLNVVFVGDQAVCSPLHTGILPARFEANGKIIRGLGRENDKAFDLLATFSPDQLQAATIAHDVNDLLFGPGHPDTQLAPQGLRGADMTEAQRRAMLSLIDEWVGVLNESHAAPRLNALRQSLPETRFAWSGPTTHDAGINGESYFRIHGPSLVIEHAPQQNQGGYKVHVHTVMRDLKNDYGKQLV